MSNDIFEAILHEWHATDCGHHAATRSMLAVRERQSDAVFSSQMVVDTALLNSSCVQVCKIACSGGFGRATGCSTIDCFSNSANTCSSNFNCPFASFIASDEVCSFVAILTEFSSSCASMTVCVQDTCSTISSKCALNCVARWPAALCFCFERAGFRAQRCC